MTESAKQKQKNEALYYGNNLNFINSNRSPYDMLILEIAKIFPMTANEILKEGIYDYFSIIRVIKEDSAITNEIQLRQNKK